MTEPSLPALLEVASLGVRIGNRWIVEGVTFQAYAGKITAIIGPNGAGKSTLLEAMTGLRRRNAGEVRVAGRRLDRFADYARSFSFLPDVGAMPPEATVRTLVEHASALASRDMPFRRLREGLALEPLLPKTVGILSRGEHQRVALFCTLALRRPIVVLDEPFAAFDPLQLRSVLALVRNVADESTAVVASIHQLADAEKVADHVLLLANGKAVAFGDPASLRAQAGSVSASLEDAFVALLSRTHHAP